MNRDTDTDNAGETGEPSLADLRGSAEQLNAYAGVPGGYWLRLVGCDTDDGWVEAVEIGTPGSWTRIAAGHGLKPTRRYNQFVDELTAHDIDDERGPQAGDSDIKRSIPIFPAIDRDAITVDADGVHRGPPRVAVQESAEYGVLCPCGHYIRQVRSLRYIPAEVECQGSLPGISGHKRLDKTAVGAGGEASE